MPQHSPGSLDQWLYILTQGTVPNLRQIWFCWMEIPDQNMIMNLNIFVATISLLKCSLITLWIWHSHSSTKRKRRPRNCFKIPTSTGIVVAHVIIVNTPSKFFRLHLGTNFLSFDWGLLVFSFSNLFLFSFPLPPMLLLKSSHRPKLTESEPCFATSKES